MSRNFAFSMPQYLKAPFGRTHIQGHAYLPISTRHEQVDETVEEEKAAEGDEKISTTSRGDLPITFASGTGYMGSGEIHALGFLPAAEGLRGLAILRPMLDHSMPGSYDWNTILGSMGVTIFFVLSGFLITGVLLNLQEKTDVKKNCTFLEKVRQTYRHLVVFYMDRVVRLFPAVFIVVSAGCYMSGRDKEDWGGINNLKNGLRALLSLQNTPYLQGASSPFEFSWSLACEEQFYVVWSLLLPFLSRQNSKIILLFLGVTTLASIGCRQIAGMGYDVHWSLSWNRGLVSNVYKMLFGCTLRLVPFPVSLTKRVYSFAGLLLILVAGCLPRILQSSNHWKQLTLICDLISCLGATLIILGTLKHHNSILESTLLRFLGRLSYALYLWTTLWIMISGNLWQGWKSVPWQSLGVVCAMISTIYVEEPIRRFYRNTLRP